MSAKHGVLCPRPTMKWLLALGSLAAHTTLVGAVSTYTRADKTFVALYDLTQYGELSDPLITADYSRDNFMNIYKLSDATNSASLGSQTFAATVDLASIGCDSPSANKAYRVVTTTADGTQTVSDQVNLGGPLDIAEISVVSDPSLDGTQKTVEVEFDCGVGFASIQANGVELLDCAGGSAGIPCTACAGTEYASGVLGSECAETTTFVLSDLLDSQGGRQALSAAWAASGECDAV